MKISKKQLFSFTLNKGIDLIHLVVSFVLIFIVAYFFGFEILTKPLYGNDAINNLTLISFFGKYYPQIPFWFSGQGGGEAPILGYPQLYSFAVIILSQLSNLRYVSAMGILNFLSLLIPAFGIYLFVSLRFKNKTVALIASLFYFLSPASYVFIMGAGFLAQTFSVIFVPFYLILLDRFLEGVLAGKTNVVLLFLLIIISILVFLAHPVTLMGLLIFSGLYTTGLVIIGKQGSLKDRVVRGLLGLILIAFFTFGAISFWYRPLQYYLGYANRDLKPSLDDVVTFAPFTFKGVLGLLSVEEYGWGDFSVLPAVWILAVFGAIGGFFYNKKVAIISIIALASLYFLGSLTLWKFFGRFSFFIADLFTLRPWYPLTVLITPIAGAFGVFFIAKTILLPLSFVSRKLEVFRGIATAFLTIILSYFLVSLLIPLTGFYNSFKPYYLPVGSRSGINMKGIWNRTFEEKCEFAKDNPARYLICNDEYLSDYFEMNSLAAQCDLIIGEKPVVCQSPLPDSESYSLDRQKQKEGKIAFAQRCLAQKQNGIGIFTYNSPCLALGENTFSQMTNWPLPVLQWGRGMLGDPIELPTVPFETLAIVQNPFARVDVSPHLGTTVKAWSLLFPSSILNTYTGQLSLIKSYYSIFNDAFYGKSWKPPQAFNNLAGYFGTQAVFIDPKQTPLSRFEDVGWKATEVENRKVSIMPPFKTGLVTVGTIPQVLVVGSIDKGVYKQVFKAVTFGALPYQKAVIVDGGENLSNYSSEDLAKYEGIIMVGVSYDNRSNELEKLKEYVNNGGSVFIDTGWQYVSEDWGQSEERGEYATDFPDPIPVEKSTWGSTGNSLDNAKIDPQFDKDITIYNFAPLVWEQYDWNIAYSESLKPWAKPVLSNKGQVIVAGGQYGKGKIVWSGMNIVAHALDKENTEEINFLSNIFSYLLGDNSVKEIDSAGVDSSYPDNITIKFTKDINEKTSIYLKESYFPTWKAVLFQDGHKINLPINKAGPSFMIVSFDSIKAGDTVTFTFTAPSQLLTGSIITLLSILLLMLVSIDSIFNKSRLTTRIIQLAVSFSLNLTHPFKQGFGSIRKEFNKEDEDY